MQLARSLLPWRWHITAAYTAAIYISLPFMRPLLNHLREALGDPVLSMAANSSLALAAGLLIFLALRLGPVRIVLVAIPLIAAGAYALTLERPEERVHFVQYGGLGILVSLCLGRGRLAPLLALLIAGAAGALDEGIQHMMASRVGDLRDVGINVFAAAVGVWTERTLR